MAILRIAKQIGGGTVPDELSPEMDAWWLLDSGPTAAELNMAFDETLLERCARWGRPVLRFYGW
ncbi:MAG TPA: hypothetical protein VMB21_10935, partial [Candidatus Limnocylindria bacterium]|nr:hypothetical protein [Candidatus Limnocylindria bacterium]